MIANKLDMAISLDRPSPDSRPLAKNHAHIWSGVVIHHTGLPVAPGRKDPKIWARLFRSIAGWLTKKDNIYVSSHFIIGRSGELGLLVDPDTHIAWHSGKSSFWNPTKRSWLPRCNDFMIGIEIVGDGNKEEYSQDQYMTAAKLCAKLLVIYPDIKPNTIVGHEMVSPGRKVDPGRFFNWKLFFILLHHYRERSYE